MTTTNDITGDAIRSKSGNSNYYENYGRIFGKKDKTANENTSNEQSKVLVNSSGSVPGVHSEGDDNGNSVVGDD